MPAGSASCRVRDEHSENLKAQLPWQMGPSVPVRKLATGMTHAKLQECARLHAHQVTVRRWGEEPT